ncbi:MAG: DUF305 domain-containing protein [Actinomycetota bacterium]
MRGTQGTRELREDGRSGTERLGPSLPLIAALAAALALFVALVALISSREPGDTSPEAGFARDMMVHHAQAVEMAQILQDKTDDRRLETLAEDIALTQQNQIGQMQGWLAVWGLPVTGSEPPMSWMGHPVRGRMPGMASPEEINRLRNASPEEAERLFLQLMIPHHRAAVEMSEAILEHTSEPAVRRLANAILDSQRSEIRTMKQLLRERGSPPPGTEDEQMQHDEHGG